MGPGTVVGEIGLYLNVPRTATVIAETPCVVYRLSKDKIDLMRTRSPVTAAAFHQYMVCLLAERLADSNRTLKAMLD
jgi:SulP family sulfate permease